MIPDNSVSLLSVPAVSGAFRGAKSLTVTNTIDYESGGIAIGDTSEGLEYQYWSCYINADGTTITIKGLTTLVETVIYTGASITECSLAFTWNMSPVIAFVEAGVAKLRYFSGVAGDYVVVNLPTGATTPRLTLDDKRELLSNESDVICAFISADNELTYCQQRDNYEVFIVLQSGVTDPINKIGMGTNNRLQFQLGIADSVEPTQFEDVPEVYQYALVYDIALNRWGKIKVPHVAVVDINIGAHTIETPSYYQSYYDADPAYSAQVGDYLTDPAYIEAVGRPKRDICLLRSDGSISMINVDEFNDTADGVIVIGKIQINRKNTCAIQSIRVENAAAANFELTVSTAQWGKVQDTLTTPVLRDESDDNYKAYDTRVTGKNHLLNIQGAYELSYLELDLTDAGTR